MNASIYFFGDIMNKWKRKKQLWKIRKARKGNCQKRKNSSVLNDGIASLSVREAHKPFVTKEFKRVVPEVFSIVENAEETLAFFNDVILEIKEKHYKEKFSFDLKNVKRITIDAVMYLLAIMENIHSSKLNQTFSGNHPDDLNVRNVLIESGFYKYVNSNIPMELGKTSHKIQICEGSTVDARLVKSICDFVNQSCGTVKQFTHKLYEILIEIMTNTVQHAYSADEIWEKHNWYVFTEDKEDCIQFTFLDIGEGIPKTIYKNFIEKIIPSLFVNDADYIVSALNGKFRSQTGLESRGNGLPTVKEYGERPEVVEMHVISGKGICIFDTNGKSIIKKGTQKELDGTLFYWKIKKSRIKEEYIK